jgi:hypothetical protein
MKTYGWTERQIHEEISPAMIQRLYFLAACETEFQGGGEGAGQRGADTFDARMAAVKALGVVS